jgi:hypothetical protein
VTGHIAERMSSAHCWQAYTDNLQVFGPKACSLGCMRRLRLAMMGRALQERLAQALPDLPARSLRLFFQQAAHDAMISQEPGAPCHLSRIVSRMCN